MAKKQQKQKNPFLTERELIKLVLRFDRLYLHADMTDEQLSRLHDSEEYRSLGRQEALYFTRGMRECKSPEGMHDLMIAGCLQTVIKEATAKVSNRCLTLREEDSWSYWFTSPFARNLQADVQKLFEQTIPFDLEAFGEIYVYSQDHLRFLFHLVTHELISEKIAGLLTMHEVKVDPLIWKRRREVSATQ